MRVVAAGALGVALGLIVGCGDEFSGKSAAAGSSGSSGTAGSSAGTGTGGAGGDDSPSEAGASASAGGSGAAASSCDAGDTRECTGPGACRGGQVCERGEWSACDCGGDPGTGGEGGEPSGAGGGAGRAPSAGEGGEPGSGGSEAGAGGEATGGTAGGGAGGAGGTGGTGSCRSGTGSIVIEYGAVVQDGETVTLFREGFGEEVFEFDLCEPAPLPWPPKYINCDGVSVDGFEPVPFYATETGAAIAESLAAPLQISWLGVMVSVSGNTITLKLDGATWAIATTVADPGFKVTGPKDDCD